MLRHESLVRFRHILDHAREAVAMVAGTRTNPVSKREMNAASVRLSEVTAGVTADAATPSSLFLCVNPLPHFLT